MHKALFSVAVLAACCAARADFINGGFETGDYTGWTVQPAASGSRDGVLAYSDFFFETPANAGNYLATFSAAYGQPDTISQTLSTVSGQSYTLSFLAGEDYQAQGENLDVTWDGTTLFNGAVPAVFDPSNGLPVMQEFSFTVTGTGSDTASFAGYDNPAAIGLDSVSLTPLATPEPAPMAVFGLGALGLILRRRSSR